MESKGPYELEIRIEASKRVVVDDLYTITYTIKNRGDASFPGGNILIEMRWSSVSSELVNNHPMEIGELAPGATTQFSFNQRDEVSGMTYLSRPVRSLGDLYKGKDGIPIRLFLPNGNEVPERQVIHSTRVRSREEVSQSRANWIAAISLIALIVIELAKWYFGL